MIKLRLRRMGSAKRPSYRIVVAHSPSPRDGRFIETVGYYDPITQPATVKINEERARHWLSVGAQPSDTVRDILRRAGLVEGRAFPVAATETPAVEEAASAPKRRGAASAALAS